MKAVSRARTWPALLLPAILVCSIVRLWIMPLPSSFWVDEMVTEFVVKRGAADPSLAVAPQVPYSIYYWLPRWSQWLFGSSEVAYRAPSVLLMGGTLILVARLAARLIHPRAGWFAAFACLALAGFNYQAADARPYGLGACISAAGVLLLVRWLDTARWRDGLLFAISAALLWRVHLVFWPFYLVFAGYAAARLLRRETPVRWSQAWAIFGLTAAALVPVALDALALFRDAEAHVIVKPPSFHEFEHALRWNVVLLSAAGAWLLSRVTRGVRLAHLRDENGANRRKAPGLAAGNTAASAPRISATSLGLLLGWWLCQPFCLFALSRITGESVFVRRYFFLMLPGVALVSAAAASRFIRPSHWRFAAALMGAAGLLWLGQWDRLWPAHEHSDWRGAARDINALLLDTDTPVICPSPFIEARPPVWSPEYRLPGFLYAHLPVYPTGGRQYLFPFETSAEAEQYAAQLARGTLSASRRFMLYGGNGATRFWRKWFSARPELASWKSVRHPFGDVDVVVFEAPARQGSE